MVFFDDPFCYDVGYAVLNEDFEVIETRSFVVADVFLDKENEEVVATIQWLESVKTDEKSKYFSISTALSATETAFYREKAMDVWIKTGQGLSFYLNAMCK